MSTDLVRQRPEDFPPEVHASLADLRRIAREAKSRDDPGLRQATPDELALARLLLKPHACGRRSSRTGLPCALAKVSGADTCNRHGYTKRAQAKAERALARMAVPVLTQLHDYALDTDPKVRQSAVKASSDILDRANIGAITQAKVRASHKSAEAKSGVTVHIGFLKVTQHTPTLDGPVLDAETLSDTEP